jgi:tetratricopeptide (TPR) repeat protein
MKALAVRLAPLVGSDETRNTLKTMVLDASFVSDDYDSALDILRQGIADRDESWHLMAISKVEAHKALKEERPRDAVKHFREFMAAFSAAKDEITSDPVTGVIFSREMILGRNAKRIGDIYKEIPDDEAATKAYAEARGYYQKALAAEQDREAIKIINQELSEVP